MAVEVDQTLTDRVDRCFTLMLAALRAAGHADDDVHAEILSRAIAQCLPASGFDGVERLLEASIATIRGHGSAARNATVQ